MQRRRNSDVLVELVPLKDRRVIDVGSGDGALTRLMAKHGAHVLGLETSERQLAKALAGPQVADEAFAEGEAQDLPAHDGTVDVVVFFNSLHHVPVEDMDRALAEAARVLKPDGLLYVSEPVAEGPFFELCQPVDDETFVRAKALEAIRGAGRFGLVEERELTYIHTVVMADYQAFADRIVSANAEREATVAAMEARLREAFARIGTPTANGFSFDQPSRVNLLRKSG